MTARRVVIVGAGYAGLRLARLLDGWAWRHPVDVTLIDRAPFHTLRPRLPLAVGGRVACAAHVPLAGLLADTRVRVLTRDVTGIDPAAHRVTWEGGTCDADALVLAFGGGPRVPADLADDPGAVLPIWELDQACGIRRRVQFLAGAARERRPVDANVLVIGGGFLGVEVAAEVQARLERLYDRRAHPVVILVERRPRLLPRLSAWAGRKAAARLSRLGVEVLTGVSAVRVAGGRVHVEGSGSLSAGTVVWAGGNIQAPAVAAACGLTDATGRIPVTPALELDGHAGVFALGDCAYRPTTDDRESEPSAHRAELQAATAIRNIAARLDGGRMAAHRPRRNVYVLGLGPGYGLVEAGPVRAAGPGLSMLKDLVAARHLAQAGGAGVLRRALPRVVLDGFRPAAWDQVPLADGVVDVRRPA
jgi:NADH:ubiquinone reductase (H+-translocating)